MESNKNRLNDLGFKRPKKHTEESKKTILQVIENQAISVNRKRANIRWAALSGIAASLFLFFSLTQSNNSISVESQAIVKEDVFVTSLLMDTLLLEETELDQAIQEALLDNFENDLALK